MSGMRRVRRRAFFKSEKKRKSCAGLFGGKIIGRKASESTRKTVREALRRKILRFGGKKPERPRKNFPFFYI